MENGRLDTTLSKSIKETAAKQKWLIKLRWVAIAAQALCVLPGLYLGLLSYRSLSLYFFIVLGLIGFNTSFYRLTKYMNLSSEWVLFIHLAVDLLALGGLLSISHGCHNPLVVLIYLNAAIGPLILSGTRNLAFLVATCLCLGMVCFNSITASHIEHGLIIPKEIKLTAEILVVIVIWHLTRWLAKELHQLRSSLETLERQKSRTDNLRALGAMAASFSHEFSTPLNTIKVRLERMKRVNTHNDERFQADITSAISGVDQCEQVLRSLFKTSNDSTPVRFEDIKIAEFTQQACQRWLGDRTDIRLRIRADEKSFETICRVPGLILARSIIDLLDNAAEAACHYPTEVNVSIITDNHYATLEISDHGKGMASEIRNKIGEPFLSTKECGAGLGLFTAYSLAEALGGFLAIRDTRGGGTTVSLSIPVISGVL